MCVYELSDCSQVREHIRVYICAEMSRICIFFLTTLCLSVNHSPPFWLVWLARMLLAIHLPPPYHFADMISHAWSFTKVQREYEFFGLAVQRLLPTELSSQSPSGYGLSQPSCHAFCSMCVSVSEGIFSHRNGSIPTCLSAYTHNRVSLLSGELIQRWTCSYCSLWGTEKTGCIFKTWAFLPCELKASVPLWRMEKRREGCGKEEEKV